MTGKVFLKLSLTLILAIQAFVGVSQLDSLKTIINEREDNGEKVEWMAGIASDYFTIDPTVTEQIGLEAIELGRKYPEFYLGNAKANHITGISYWVRGMYLKALEYYLSALPLYELAGDERRANGLRIDIANIYGDSHQYEQAIGILREVIQYAKLNNDTLLLSWANTNIGSNFNKVEEFDSAISHYRESIPLLEYLRDTVGIALVHGNIASMYLNRNNPDSAISYLVTARKQLDLKYDPTRLSEVYINLGLYELAKQSPFQAKKFLDSASLLVNKLESKNFEVALLEAYSDTYKELGQYEDAVYLLKRSHALEDSISGLEVREQVRVLELQYENERKEKELAELAKETAEERGLRNIIIVSSGSVILIIGLLLFLAYQKRKKDRQIARIKVQQLKEEVNSKNKEISSYTLSFIQKNQIMDELKAQINELKKQSDPSVNKQLNRINKIVDETFRSDEEWKSFQLTFEQMHDGFFTSLKETYPDLGNAELKLCALLRLNMNLKESARILGISPESVKTARYRLRKKMGLKTEDNLVDFLLKFEQEQLPKMA